MRVQRDATIRYSLLVDPEIAAIRQHSKSLVEQRLAVVDAPGHESEDLAVLPTRCKHSI